MLFILFLTNGYVEMPDCKSIQRLKQKVCIAGMRHRIDLFFRALQPITKDGVDFDEAFENKHTVWALLDTRRGVVFFDDTNIEQRTTHRFIFRFIPEVIFNVTSEDFIVFRGRRYRVINAENLEEDDTFHQVDCVVRGNELLEATKV